MKTPSLYNLLIRASEKTLLALGSLNPKMKLFVEGRKKVFPILKKAISEEEKTIWFHCASLGEYEQALPVIKEIKKLYPNHKIVLTFFSPSGYENKRDNNLADVTIYLPLDTPKNAEHFLDLVHPEWAIFIKYEFWPNYLAELKNRKIKTLLISGVFRKDQLFFKWYGKWMRDYLMAFEHFFVQDEKSKELLGCIDFSNVTISGDTRFDRVSHQIEQDNTLNFISEFKNNKICVVAGSTWPEDEKFLVDFINTSSEDLKFIIAPHTLKPAKILQLRQLLKPKTVLFSEKEGKELSSYKVFIIDTIGLLNKIYSYADIAYVGGAAGNTGLHNILEPATFGLPIITGKNISKFPEAIRLQQLAGLFTVGSKEELSAILSKLIRDKAFRQKTGMISGHFINSNTGATALITEFFRNGS
ncbi:MAG TPA: glycosyltransferase N-terminal domain-containing protein [Salinimicrobium sp.]|nr:glycosyltransferase N-terminal domain-containing protein [Salinimicrobium sp.]